MVRLRRDKPKTGLSAVLYLMSVYSKRPHGEATTRQTEDRSYCGALPNVLTPSDPMVRLQRDKPKTGLAAVLYLMSVYSKGPHCEATTRQTEDRSCCGAVPNVLTPRDPMVRLRQDKPKTGLAAVLYLIS